jgi:serine/threonine-protein kinase
MAEPSLAPIGVVAQYNLLEALAPSGPGELYRARDTRRGRTVALRVLPAAPDEAAPRERDGRPAPAEPARGAGGWRRVVEQGRELAGLSHPNVTAVFDVGEHEGRVYVAFEFLNGRSLRAEMGGRPVNPRRAVDVAIQIADGVAYAHGQGFGHGGLSPESVVVTANGHAKIPAFELAARAGFDPSRGEGRLSDYQAPEEARGEAPDDRSDVYSVGAILYDMLTARRPPHRGAAAPSAWNARVPAELDRLVLKAVAPNPDFRHASAALLAGELRGVANAMDRAERLDARSRDEPRPADLGRALLMAAAILGAVGVIAWWIMRS